MPCGTLPHTQSSHTPYQIPHLWQHPSQCFCCFDPHQRDTNVPRGLWGSGVGFCCIGFSSTHTQKQRPVSDLVQHCFGFSSKRKQQDSSLTQPCTARAPGHSLQPCETPVTNTSQPILGHRNFKAGPADPQGQQHCPPTTDNPCANCEWNFSRDYLCYYMD